MPTSMPSSMPTSTRAPALLRHLKIDNLATIESLSLEFSEGLNIITGETGTGKSTLLSALALILGERADVGLIRAGCTELSVEAVFEVAPEIVSDCLPDCLPDNSPDKLSDATLDRTKNDEDLIIRRTVYANGKGKIIVAGEFVTRAELSKITQ